MKVTINRKDNFFNLARDYKVVLDGEIIGSISNNNSFTFELKNDALLMMKIDWCISNEIELKPVEDELHLITHCNVKGWKMIFILFYISIFYKSYLTLYKK